jgi:FixJ family two-component response regulator
MESDFLETISLESRSQARRSITLLSSCQYGNSCCEGRHLKRLSPREREAFFHVVAGLSSKELASAMRIQDRTAENYRSRVLAKIKARNAAEAVHFAVRHGLLVA